MYPVRMWSNRRGQRYLTLPRWLTLQLGLPERGQAELYLPLLTPPALLRKLVRDPKVVLIRFPQDPLEPHGACG